MKPNSISKISVSVFWLLFALVLWFLFERPIQDIDYWWHIALGREMFEQWSFFQVDPFGIYSAVDPIRSETVLQGQWVGQVLLFLGQHWLGDAGVQVIRYAIVLATLFIFYVRFGHQVSRGNERTIVLLFGLAFLIYVLQAYSGERPQLFSILYMSLAMYLIESIRHTSKRLNLAAGLLIILLVIWANTHGAFLLFIAILGFTVSARMLFSKPEYRSSNLKKWMLLGSIALLATLISPNGLQTYLYLFALEGSELQQRTSEYVNIFQLFQTSTITTALVFSLYAILSLVTSGVLFREKRFEQGLLIIILILIGLSAYRYFVFAVIVTLPVVLTTVVRIINFKQRAKIFSLIFGLMAIISLTALSVMNAFNVKPYFPEKVPNILKEQNTQGVIFNTVNIGGYLLWHGYPTMRPFIDGRILDTNILIPYTNALWLTDYGRQWFDQQQFETVFMSSENFFTHEGYPLVAYLKRRNDYTLAYEQGGWIGFIRN